MKFVIARPLKQVSTGWSGLGKLDYAGVSKSFCRLKISYKENPRKWLHLNTVHYPAEMHSNSILLIRDKRSIGNIAPIRSRIYRSLVGICFFSSIDYQGSFQKSEESLINEKEQTMKDFSLNTSQILDTSQQNPLSDKIGHLNSILVALKDLQSNNGQYINLTKKFLSDPEFLKFAYYRIKNKLGNLILATTSVAFDGMCKEWFERIAKDIAEGKYIFKDCCHVYILKTEKKSKRLITIVNFRDKIVQKAMQIVCEEIFERKENYFSPYSHGFRPGKSCHTALEQIKTKWTAIPWYIKFDIVKCFDEINRSILINQLNKIIKDCRFIDLFQKMFKARIFIMGSKENQSQIIQETLGVLQGNILCPILSNIFFTPLDNFMKQLIKKYHKGKKASVNLGYMEECAITKKDLSMIPENKQTTKLIRKMVNKKKREALKKRLRYTLFDDNYVRVKYVRYANDFIVGVRASKKTVIEIKKEVILFLKSSLHLQINENKTRIFQTYCEKVNFLGMKIHNVPIKHLSFRRVRHLEQIKRNKSRIVNRKLAMQNRRFKIFHEQILNGLKTRFKQVEDKGNLSQWKQKLEKAIYIVRPADSFDNASRQVFTQFINEVNQFWHLDQDNALRNFLENDDKLNSGKTKETVKKDRILVPITRKEILRRIIAALELENLKVLGSKFGKYGSFFDEVGEILYCPDTIIFSSSLKVKLNKINNTSKARCKEKKILKEVLYWLKEEGRKKEFLLMNSKIAEKVREHWKNNRVRTSLPPQITINLDKLYKKLEQNKIINSKKKPIAKTSILIAEDYYVIKDYKNSAYGLMSYFRSTININKLKEIIRYHLRYSLLYTLMNKHKLSSVKAVLANYGKNIQVVTGNRKIEYMNLIKVSLMKSEFLANPIQDLYEKMDKIFPSLQSSKFFE